MTKLFSVYVIKSNEGFRYTGMTEDLKNRLQEHNSKSKSFWTKRGNNWQIIFRKDFTTKTEVISAILSISIFVKCLFINEIATLIPTNVGTRSQ